ncbi:sterol desaturase family protein [Sandarakinorhabdus sp.]|uniref:sterol desaturase family protein n=1 Tax=Sandarakinorhabdus sp. TaxID=1916663 RepID=UPI00286DC522|nr:sterol desaturase family protein [Sandarakinorhabdus sp.]
MIGAGSIFLGVLGMTVIVAVRYLLVSGSFALWTARRGITAGPANPQRRRAQIRAEIGWSLLSAVIYAVPAGLAVELFRRYGWTQMSLTVDTLGEAIWWPISIGVYLFAHDTWFYWTHRWMHTPRWFKRVHAVHHASKPPTAWAAMSFHPTEAISGAVLIPSLMFIVPIHVGALAVVLTIASVMGVTNHMGWEMFPARWVNGWFGRHVISASHHETHHRHYNCNYGLYFRFWDRLCGTDTGLAQWKINTL